jgi:hypothetical protein
VEGKVKSDNPALSGDLSVIEYVTKLAAIGTRCMQTQQGNTLASLFIINTIVAAKAVY